LVDAGTGSQIPFWFMDFSLSLEKIWTGCSIFEKLALKKRRPHEDLHSSNCMCIDGVGAGGLYYHV
jgi:hypothetical protein